MRTRTFVAVASVFALTGALGMACSSTTTEDVPACDPATDPACTSAETGGDTNTTIDGADPDGLTIDSTVTDGTVPDFGTPDGITKYPDGSIVLPDGAVRLPDGAIITDGGAYPCVPGSTQCTDCIDNDGDGLVDWLDPECTGPLDRDESSYATGIPGDNIDPCKQDCWFDGNSGAGDDGCLFPSKCLPGSKDPKCPYDPVAAAGGRGLHPRQAGDSDAAEELQYGSSVHGALHSGRRGVRARPAAARRHECSRTHTP